MYPSYFLKYIKNLFKIIIIFKRADKGVTVEVV